MISLVKHIRSSLTMKLILTVGSLLVIYIIVWAFFNIRYQKQKLMDNIIASTDRLTHTILLGTQYAMMLNSRDDITQIIANIGKLPEIVNIRIYNKAGEIKFSNHKHEIDTKTNIRNEACIICHRSDPPLKKVSLKQRIRIFRAGDGHHLLGIITPIANAPGCATGECHFHPKDNTILGALDVVVSLAGTEKEIVKIERSVLGFSVFIFMITSGIIFVFLHRFVNIPIRKLIAGTEEIARGNYTHRVKLKQVDEMGKLAEAVNQMAQKIHQHQQELNRQRDEYQKLFEGVPCLITVQDRSYRLLKYNSEFARRFAPKPGDFCYQAYKGRDSKCERCPVEATFADGQPHWAEESGINKDGSRTYWMVQTSPIRDENGNVVAAMEISLDITQRKLLEEELKHSEKKYHDIFSNIPNPVFVVDRETLEILDYNKSVTSIYGFSEKELIGKPFTFLFKDEDYDHWGFRLRTASNLYQIRHKHSSGHTIYVNIRISPSEYAGKNVLLITTSDITKRLETEQQLIQASKMATLGEMATGIAHELNQPLSVIKTTSSFFISKLRRNEDIDMELLTSMLDKVDRNVDRATRIINHMRQFARKSDSQLCPVDLNNVIQSAFEIFSQQLKVRGIAIKWSMAPSLPQVTGDPGRLEQVFINLLLNARDAIEESRQEGAPGRIEIEDCITIETGQKDAFVFCRLCDTGCGIPQDIKEKIFEPFFTTKEVGKGTGLGLSISYGIIKDCGGRISVHDNRPRGTCFLVELPTYREEDQQIDNSGASDTNASGS